MNLTNNTILITGGTSGFGYEFAARLLALGNTVLITGRNAAKLEETKTKLPGIHTFVSDVSNPDAIRALYDVVVGQFPSLNMIINNAGEMRIISLHDNYPLEDITREIEINLMGPVRMVQQFLPHLKTKSNAAILNVTSGIAVAPFAISPIYSATKSGLRSYTKLLRVQLGKTNVKVFELIAPGSSTALGDKFKALDGYDDKIAMDPVKLIDVAIKGLQNDTFEIYPGMAKMLRIMSRLAPAFLLKQMAKVGASFYLKP